MKSNMRILVILLMPIIFLSQCSLINVKNTFYSNNELALLEKSLNAIEYWYGYDFEIELNYIYSYSYSKDNVTKKEKAVTDIFNASDFKLIIGLYEKILKLQAITDYKIEKYKSDSKWKHHTFIKNEFRDPLSNYSNILSKYVLQKNPGLSEFFEMKKESLKKEVNMEYRDKDSIEDTF